MRRPAPREIALVALGLAMFAAAVAIVRTTAAVGNDFNVFWTAANATLRGVSPYSVDVGQGMVFKYPPWILPLFLPLGLIPLEAARWVWGLLEVACIAYVLSWLVRKGCDKIVVFATALGFWGIWAVHALDGQITLVMLAAMLLSVERLRPAADLGWRALVLIWAGSAKIFTVFVLLGVARPLRRWASVGHLALALALAGGLSVPALLVTPGGSPVTLVKDWLGSAESGGVELAGEKIRGRDNQGIPVMILRAMDVRADRKSMDVLAFLLAALILGGSWSVVSAGLGFTERWVGWVALGAVVHPLAWFHSFVFAFPLAAVAIDRAIKRRNGISIAITAAGILCIAVITSKILGRAGLQLELVSIKSWGVILCLGGLKLAAQRKIGKGLSGQRAS